MRGLWAEYSNEFTRKSFVFYDTSEKPPTYGFKLFHITFLLHQKLNGKVRKKKQKLFLFN